MLISTFVTIKIKMVATSNNSEYRPSDNIKPMNIYSSSQL